MFHPVEVLFLVQIRFYERSYAPELRNLRKKRGAPLPKHASVKYSGVTRASGENSAVNTGIPLLPQSWSKQAYKIPGSSRRRMVSS